MLESKVSNLFEGELSLGCCLNPRQLHNYTITKTGNVFETVDSNVWNTGLNPLSAFQPLWRGSTIGKQLWGHYRHLSLVPDPFWGRREANIQVTSADLYRTLDPNVQNSVLTALSADMSNQISDNSLYGEVPTLGNNWGSINDHCLVKRIN